ncbi:MAG: hypothetical protein WBO43_10670 [Gemmatimonadota bacterium]
MNTRQIFGSLAVVSALNAILIPGTARPQDAMLASAVADEAKEIAGMKSEGTATLLSFAGTAIPTTLGLVLANSGDGGGSAAGLLLFSYGMYFGPATGYWYAGASGAGWEGVGTRVGITLAGTLAMAAVCSGGRCDIFGDDSAMAAAGVVGLLTLAATAYSMIHDIAGADNHVRRHNAEIVARQQAPRLTIAPVLSPADGGTVGVFGRLRM